LLALVWKTKLQTSCKCFLATEAQYCISCPYSPYYTHYPVGFPLIHSGEPFLML